MVHSPFVVKEMAAGHKFVAMEEVTSEMLIKGGCQEDYPRMQELSYKVRALLTEGKQIRVTSELGTDITANIEGRPGYVCAGKAEKQPNIDLFCAAFPDGEAGIAPVEGTGEGVVVFDTAMHFLGKIMSPLSVKVSKGKAVGFSGEQAEELQEILTKFGDQYSYNFPAEISVGLNSKVILTGSVRTDKKLYGSAHMAFGMNADVGGLTPGKLHIDGVIRYPNVIVDGNMIVNEGALTLD
jgi:leucyl aminopeptidase (aminopeptidase T)